MSKLGFFTGGGLEVRDVFSFSVGGLAAASTSPALTTAFKGECIDSLRGRPDTQDNDLGVGECKTRGLSISVGAAERGVVCIFLRDPNIDFRV